MSQASDVDSTRAAGDFLMQDSTLKTYYRVKRSLQESFWQCLRRAYYSEKDALLAALDAADEMGPGSVEYDPEFPMPEYTTCEIHLQPGGNSGPLAGYLYDYGLKVFMGGAADNDMIANMAASAARVPDDGKVARILDLGVSAGATTTALKRAHPVAQVHGIDISAAMVRYAHMRAVEQNIDVHFKQMAAEQLDFPDGSIDITLAMLLFHELPVPVAKRVIAEAFRVLRPGGTFTIHDSIHATAAMQPSSAQRLSKNWTQPKAEYAHASLDVSSRKGDPRDADRPYVSADEREAQFDSALRSDPDTIAL